MMYRGNTRPLIRVGGCLMLENKIRDDEGYGCAAVICTTTETETRSLMQTFGGTWVPLRRPHDHQRYFETSFIDKHGTEQWVLTCQQDIMGMAAASALATKVTLVFRPRYLIMCGIAAGISKIADQVYGDVLVPSEVWDYSTGKVVGPDEAELHFGGVGFLPRPQSKRIDPELKKLIDRLSVPGACEFHVQTGLLACGTSVMANQIAIDKRVHALEPTTMGLDMESYGIFLGAESASDPRPKALVIKSVCDYANELKSDEYQTLAAFTSSRFAEYLLTKELDYS